MSNSHLHIISAIIILLVAAAVAGVFIIAQRQALRLTTSTVAKRLQREHDDPELQPEVLLRRYQLDADKLQLTTSDGVHLFALYKAPQNGAVVILCHGYKMSSAEMIPIAALLARHGYGVLLFDFRAHGRSEGEDISFGYHEWRDLEAAVDFVAHQRSVRHIGVFGNSMGGAIALYYTARDPRVAAVVAQSPYASVAHSINKGVRRFSNLPSFPFAPLIHFFAQRRLHINTAAVAPINTIAAIAPRPILLMMGGNDHVVEANGAFALQKAAGDNCELWFDAQLDHVEFYQELPQQFERRVINFYDRYLSDEVTSK